MTPIRTQDYGQLASRPGAGLGGDDADALSEQASQEVGLCRGWLSDSRGRRTDSGDSAEPVADLGGTRWDTRCSQAFLIGFVGSAARRRDRDSAR